MWLKTLLHVYHAHPVSSLLSPGQGCLVHSAGLVPVRVPTSGGSLQDRNTPSLFPREAAKSPIGMASRVSHPALPISNRCLSSQSAIAGTPDDGASLAARVSLVPGGSAGQLLASVQVGLDLLSGVPCWQGSRVALRVAALRAVCGH